MKRIPLALLLAVLIPLALYLTLHFSYGYYTGTNYDAYQYTYALREGPHLEREEFATTSRVFVHALYYFLLRPLVAAGLDAWAVFAFSSVLFSTLVALLLYATARQLGASRIAALTAAVLWASSATALYYANIPEIYPLWLCTLLLTVIALWHKKPIHATLLYALSFVTYVQSILIIPMFLWLGIRRGLKWGTVAVVMGFTLLFVLLYTTGTPFMSHFARERIYLDIATSDAEWIKTNVIALRQSGMIIPLLLVIPLVARYADKTTLFLLLGIVPNLLFGLTWVKDQGAFLAPAAMFLLALFAYLAQKTKDYRLILAVALVFSLPMFQFAWKEAAYDRSLGQVQMEFCLAAAEAMEGETPLVSTAMFPRWLYTFSLKQRDRSLIKYSPWAFVESQATAMHQAKHELFPKDLPVYTDDSVHPEIVAGYDPKLVFSHSGILADGYRAELRLYRVVRLGTD